MFVDEINECGTPLTPPKLIIIWHEIEYRIKIHTPAVQHFPCHLDVLAKVKPPSFKFGGLDTAQAYALSKSMYSQMHLPLWKPH